MKKHYLFLIVLLAACFCRAQAQEVTRFALLNANGTSLKNVANLIDNDYIYADSLELLAVLHESQTSAIEAARNFIDKRQKNDMKLFIIRGEYSLYNLFGENGCTPDFYALFQQADAIIRFGGDDIVPNLYGEETFITTQVIDQSNNWELSFFYHLLGSLSHPEFTPWLDEHPNMPVMGICLGMQMMNVASGGSLYQDIPYQIYEKTTFESIMNMPQQDIHKNYWSNISNEGDFSFIHFHPIHIKSGSFLDYGIIQPSVASVHHQSPKRLGKGFRVSATSMDGKIVEAIQHNTFPNVYAIQFHTDFSVLYDEDFEFQVSPTEKISLNEDTRNFQKRYWNDFSQRVKLSLSTRRR